MIREDADLHDASGRMGSAAGMAPRPVWRAIAAVKHVVTSGTLAFRLLVAGTLLVAGLPLLTMVVYIWGYPATPVPTPIVVLVDGLQLVIVLNAIVVVAQLVGSGIRGARVADKRGLGDERRQLPASPRNGRVGLRQWALILANMIWEQERRGRPGFSEAALAYVRDAVTVELQHRRRADALARRALELGLLLTDPSASGATDHDR